MSLIAVPTHEIPAVDLAAGMVIVESYSDAFILDTVVEVDLGKAPAVFRIVTDREIVYRDGEVRRGRAPVWVGRQSTQVVLQP
jgi:hypothetical protein